MDEKKPVMDSVYIPPDGFEAYAQNDQLDEVIRPGSRWKPVHGRSISNFMLQGIFPLSFKERVNSRLKWSERDETDPEKVRQTIIEIATMLGEGANRALDEHMVRKRRPRNLEQRDKSLDQYRKEGDDPASVGVGTGGDATYLVL